MPKLARYTFHLGDEACGAIVSVRAKHVDEAIAKLRVVLPETSLAHTAHHLKLPGSADVSVFGWINADEIKATMLETVQDDAAKTKVGSIDDSQGNNQPKGA